MSFLSRAWHSQYNGISTSSHVSYLVYLGRLATFINDLCWSWDWGRETILVLLDVSVSFDTINRDILWADYRECKWDGICVMVLLTSLWLAPVSINIRNGLGAKSLISVIRHRANELAFQFKIYMKMPGMVRLYPQYNISTIYWWYWCVTWPWAINWYYKPGHYWSLNV